MDKIPVRAIKDCLPSIAPHLTAIINASFKSVTLPLTRKIADVTPLLKEGDHERPENIRPISLLPVCSTICERVAHINQFMSYLDANGLLTTEQSGNKKWHWTESSLLKQLIKFLTQLTRNSCRFDNHCRQIRQCQMSIVFLDMSKAFDSINHETPKDIGCWRFSVSY